MLRSRLLQFILLTACVVLVAGALVPPVSAADKSNYNLTSICWDSSNVYGYGTDIHVFRVLNATPDDVPYSWQSITTSDAGNGTAWGTSNPLQGLHGSGAAQSFFFAQATGAGTTKLFIDGHEFTKAANTSVCNGSEVPPLPEDVSISGGGVPANVGAAECIHHLVANPGWLGAGYSVYWVSPTGARSLILTGTVDDDGNVSLVLPPASYPADSAYGSYYTPEGLIGVWGRVVVDIGGFVYDAVVAASGDLTTPRCYVVGFDAVNLAPRNPAAEVWAYPA